MSDDVQLCVLEVAGDDYVIDIRRVEEIIAVPPLTPVPKAPRFLEGVIRLRGEVLPVLDVRRRLGVPTPVERGAGPRERRRERLVVCRVGTRRIGLVVDAVTHVVKVARASLRPAPLAASPGRAPHVLGVCGDGAPAAPPRGKLRLLLDVKTLLTEEAP